MVQRKPRSPVFSFLKVSPKWYSEKKGENKKAEKSSKKGQVSPKWYSENVIKVHNKNVKHSKSRKCPRSGTAKTVKKLTDTEKT